MAQLNFADFRIVWKFAYSEKKSPLSHNEIAPRFFGIINSETESNLKRAEQISRSDHVSNQFVNEDTRF